MYCDIAQKYRDIISGPYRPALIVPIHTKDKSQMLAGVSGFFLSGVKAAQLISLYFEINLLNTGQ